MIRILFAMALKDLRLLFRDRTGAFLAFGWPLLLAVFFGALGPIGAKPPGTVQVAIVDEDRTDASRDYVERLRGTEELEVFEAEREAAHQGVAKGEHTAYLVIEEGFGAAQGDAGSPAHLHLGVDPRQKAAARMLKGRLIEQGYARLANAPVAVEMSEVSLVEAGLPPNPFAVTFTQAIVWAVIACAATFGVSLVTERQQGTLLRLCVAPIGRGQVLAGKGLACLLTILGITAMLLGIAVVFFEVRPLSWPLLALAVAGTAVAFVGIMMILAVIGRSAQSAAGLSWAVLMSLAMLGGGMLPIFMMPDWLQQLAKVSPVSWSLLAMEGAIWRGWGFMDVMVPTAALVGLGVACFWVGARAFRYH